jgi:hypothetical protein
MPSMKLNKKTMKRTMKKNVKYTLRKSKKISVKKGGVFGKGAKDTKGTKEPSYKKSRKILRRQKKNNTAIVRANQNRGKTTHKTTVHNPDVNSAKQRIQTLKEREGILKNLFYLKKNLKSMRIPQEDINTYYTKLTEELKTAKTSSEIKIIETKYNYVNGIFEKANKYPGVILNMESVIKTTTPSPEEIKRGILIKPYQVLQMRVIGDAVLKENYMTADRKKDILTELVRDELKELINKKGYTYPEDDIKGKIIQFVNDPNNVDINKFRNLIVHPYRMQIE